MDLEMPLGSSRGAPASRAVTILLAGIAAAAWLCACGGSAGASSDTVAAASPGGVAVSPLPGTPDAAPGSQISFLGPDDTQIANVSVVGSRSGNHTGRLVAYSTGTGESFLP